MKIIWMIFAISFACAGITQASPVVPESFSSGLNTGYSLTSTLSGDLDNAVDWFVFDSNGIDSTSFYFESTIVNESLTAGLYLGDTTGFDYVAAGVGNNYSSSIGTTFNGDLVTISGFSPQYISTDVIGTGFNLLLDEGRYSLAVSASRTGSTYEFTTNATAVSTVPVPAAAWLFGSALLGFFGFSRRKATA